MPIFSPPSSTDFGISGEPTHEPPGSRSGVIATSLSLSAGLWTTMNPMAPSAVFIMSSIEWSW